MVITIIRHHLGSASTLWSWRRPGRLNRRPEWSFLIFCALPLPLFGQPQNSAESAEPPHHAGTDGRLHSSLNWSACGSDDRPRLMCRWIFHPLVRGRRNFPAGAPRRAGSRGDFLYRCADDEPSTAVPWTGLAAFTSASRLLKARIAMKVSPIVSLSSDASGPSALLRSSSSTHRVR